MLKIANVYKLIIQISEDNVIKYYVHNEELFDVINEFRLSIGTVVKIKLNTR